jgi:RNA-splicing ligase RtcB
MEQNYNTEQPEGGVPIKMWTRGVPVDDEAKVDDQIKATEGVECRKDKDVIDEIPMAYKDIDAVMAAQTDLVEVVATLKQVLCVKG